MKKNGFAPILIMVTLGILFFTIFIIIKSNKTLNSKSGPILINPVDSTKNRVWKEYISEEGYSIKYPIITYKELKGLEGINESVIENWYKNGEYLLPKRVVDFSLDNYAYFRPIEEVEYLPGPPFGSGFSIEVYNNSKMNLDQFWKKIFKGENCDDAKKMCYELLTNTDGANGKLIPSWSFEEYSSIDNRRAILITNLIGGGSWIITMNNNKVYRIGIHFIDEIENRMISSIKFTK